MTYHWYYATISPYITGAWWNTSVHLDIAGGGMFTAGNFNTTGDTGVHVVGSLYCELSWVYFDRVVFWSECNYWW